MKIISLNIWGGRAGHAKLLDFFATYKSSVDIFCLQEVWRAAYPELKGIDQTDVMTESLQEISKVLESTHEVYFHPSHMNDYGLAMFVAKSLDITEVGEIFVHKHKDYVPEDNAGKHARNIQFVKVKNNEDELVVMNFHGLWNGEGKGDSEDRILQSENIINFLQEQKDKVVLCGDFNLLPDTKSLTMLEDFGLRNPVKEYNITSTRTSYYPKEGKFADYIFVSPTIVVKDFKILSDEVSDHAPLVIDIDF